MSTRTIVVGLAGAVCALAPGCQKATPTRESVGTSAAALSSDAGGNAAPATPGIGSFAVYATEALEMNGAALVSGGSVGVENTTGPFLGGSTAAYFNSGATIQSSQTLY